VIRVLVATGVRLYREGLADALALRSGVEVLGVAATADDCVAAAAALGPDVVVCDAGMDGALDAVRAIAGETGARVLALGVPERVDEVLACAEAGASGYVTREASLDELVAAVRATMREELVIAPQMAAALLQRAGDLARSHTAHRHDETVRLTPREAEIVALIDAGLSNKQIASRLSIQPSTVKNHVHNILEKLEVEGRADAAAAVRRQLRL
jgi:DNA-binding NarL/FixJ family response regulator